VRRTGPFSLDRRSRTRRAARPASARRCGPIGGGDGPAVQGTTRSRVRMFSRPLPGRADRDRSEPCPSGSNMGSVSCTVGALHRTVPPRPTPHTPPEQMQPRFAHRLGWFAAGAGEPIVGGTHALDLRFDRAERGRCAGGPRNHRSCWLRPQGVGTVVGALRTLARRTVISDARRPGSSPGTEEQSRHNSVGSWRRRWGRPIALGVAVATNQAEPSSPGVRARTPGAPPLPHLRGRWRATCGAPSAPCGCTAGDPGYPSGRP